MRRMIVAVVGGGNGSYTFAGDLALAGHEVRMWPGSPEKHESAYQSGSVEVSGLGLQGVAALHLVSEDVAEVVADAEVVIATDPAFTQEARGRLLAPHLQPGQVVFLSPGSLGSCFMANLVREVNGSREAIFAEPATLRYLTRKVGPAAVEISGRAVALPVGVFPASRTSEAKEKLGPLFPEARFVENVLSVALLNVGPVIHPVLVLLNTGAIEHFESWDIHNEGTTPSVKRLILAHDAERIKIREALGFAPPHYPIADHYDGDAQDEWMYGRRGHTELIKSERWRESLSYGHRYIQEDAKLNLSLLCSIGRLAGIETPIADSLLTLIGAIAGEDFWATGRTLEKLGLGGLSEEELIALLGQGFAE